MADIERTMEDMWCMLQKIQENTDELLEENRNLRSLYQDLTQSLEFHVKKIEGLEKENKTDRKSRLFTRESHCHQELVGQFERKNETSMHFC